MTNREKFWTWSLSRADYVVLRILLVLIPLAYAVRGLVPAVVDWVTGAPLHWTSRTEAEAAAPVATSGAARVAFAGEVRWTIPDAGTVQRVLALLPSAETVVLLVLGAVCLWRLVTGIRAGEPFQAAVVRRLRVLALLVLAQVIVVRATALVADFAVTAPARPDPQTTVDLGAGDLLGFAVGLLLLALAECFRQGVRLRADVEGLV